MYKSRKTGNFYYIVTSKQGLVEQYELFDAGKGVSAKLVRQFKVGTQLEGCVADDDLGHLYIGEEDVGIWKYPAEPNAELLKTTVPYSEALEYTVNLFILFRQRSWTRWPSGCRCGRTHNSL